MQAPHSRDLESPSVVGFSKINEFKSVRLPLNSVVFSEFNWIWDLSPRASPFGFGFQDWVQCRYMSSAPMVTRRHLEFWWDFSILRPRISHWEGFSSQKFLCEWSAILHMLAGFDSFVFMGFEKGFEALSRSQVFGKADSFSPFWPFRDLFRDASDSGESRVIDCHRVLTPWWSWNFSAL